jgi:hypothetical protein
MRVRFSLGALTAVPNGRSLQTQSVGSSPTGSNPVAEWQTHQFHNLALTNMLL